MDRRIATMITLIVVLATVAATGPVAGTNQQSTPTAPMNGSNVSDDKAEFGEQVSSFMQTSAAEANGSVENGMWVAAFARGNASQSAMVNQRTAALENRLSALQAQRADLLNDSDDNLSDDNLSVAERARTARLIARANALQNAINSTEQAAVEAGVDRSRLETLRTEARNLTGPEVAELARGLAGAPGNGPNAALGNQSASDAPNQSVNASDDRPADGNNQSSSDSGASGDTSGEPPAEGSSNQSDAEGARDSGN